MPTRLATKRGGPTSKSSNEGLVQPLDAWTLEHLENQALPVVCEKSFGMRHFRALPCLKKAELALSWAAGVTRDEKKHRGGSREYTNGEPSFTQKGDF